jgi:hypothetical protein
VAHWLTEGRVVNIHISYFDRAKCSELAPGSQRLLAVSESKKSALILCKKFYAEFAGPGAAISLDVEENYEAILAIGSPNLVEVVTLEARQVAYRRRIQWLRWLQKIAESPQPSSRAEKLLSSFAAFFGSQIAVDIPDELMAMLVGVMPHTIAIAKLQYRQVQASGSEQLEYLKIGSIAQAYGTLDVSELRAAAPMCSTPASSLLSSLSGSP